MAMRPLKSCTLAALIFLPGCASYEPLPTPQQRAQVGVVGVAAARYVPVSNFVSRSREENEVRSARAAAGAAQAIVNAPALVNLGPALAEVGPVLAAPEVLVVLLGAGAVVGATASIDVSLQSVPAEQRQAIESAIRESAARLDAQRVFADRFTSLVAAEGVAHLSDLPVAGPAALDEAPNYVATGQKGLDSVLETSIVQVLFGGCPYRGPGERFLERRGFLFEECPGGPRNPSLYLFVEAKVRLVSVRDNEEILVRRLSYYSPRRPFTQWMADEGKLLHEELDRAFSDLARQASDEVFLTTPVDLPAHFVVPADWDPAYGLCWLAPVSPRAEPVRAGEIVSQLFTPIPGRNLCPSSGIHFSKVDSLQPTLRWSALPNRYGGPVTYDLRIWRVEDCMRRELVYARDRLAQPEHRLQEPLLPGERYFWSFRARFTAEGRAAATPWAFFGSGPPATTTCFLNQIPEGQYHRFVTPSQQH